MSFGFVRMYGEEHLQVYHYCLRCRKPTIAIIGWKMNVRYCCGGR